MLPGSTRTADKAALAPTLTEMMRVGLASTVAGRLVLVPHAVLTETDSVRRAELLEKQRLAVGT